jgi:protein TonB
MRSYQTQVRAHIARNRPRGLPGKSGIVHVAFGLSETGRLTRIKLLRSSGDPAIDRAVLSALRHAAPFPRAPQGSTPAQRYFDMPFEFNFR